MTTVIIESKSKTAQIMIEFLKTQSYVKIIVENEGGIPNHTTIKAINEARKGKTVKCSNFEEYLEKVK